MLQILSLDPSSSVIGYAVARPDPDTRLGWAFTSVGLLKPKRQRDAPLERIDHMVDALRALVLSIAEDGLPTVLIETTSGKVSGRHGGGGAGLAVYGMAVGAVRQSLRTNGKVASLLGFTENQWTGGHGKAKHVRVARRHCPEYEALEGRDKGADIADAVALTVWYLTVQKHPEHAKATARHRRIARRAAKGTA